MRFRKTISAIFSLIMAADIISCPMLTAGAEETTTAAAVQQASLSIDFEKTMIKGEYNECHITEGKQRRYA